MWACLGLGGAAFSQRRLCCIVELTSRASRRLSRSTQGSPPRCPLQDATGGELSEHETRERSRGHWFSQNRSPFNHSTRPMRPCCPQTRDVRRRAGLRFSRDLGSRDARQTGTAPPLSNVPAIARVRRAAWAPGIKKPDYLSSRRVGLPISAFQNGRGVECDSQTSPWSEWFLEGRTTSWAQRTTCGLVRRLWNGESGRRKRTNCLRSKRSTFFEGFFPATWTLFGEHNAGTP